MSKVYSRMTRDLIDYGTKHLEKSRASLEYLRYHVFRKYNIESEEFTI